MVLVHVAASPLVDVLLVHETGVGILAELYVALERIAIGIAGGGSVDELSVIALVSGIICLLFCQDKVARLVTHGSVGGKGFRCHVLEDGKIDHSTRHEWRFVGDVHTVHGADRAHELSRLDLAPHVERGEKIDVEETYVKSGIFGGGDVDLRPNRRLLGNICCNRAVERRIHIYVRVAGGGMGAYRHVVCRVLTPVKVVFHAAARLAVPRVHGIVVASVGAEAGDGKDLIQLHGVGGYRGHVRWVER